jgi:hypothetical protein
MSGKVVRGIVTGIAVLLIGTASSLVAAGPAAAATYDGTDPSATGCASSGSTVESKYGKTAVGTTIVFVELRYSSSCRTTWARVTTVGLPGCKPGVDFCGLAIVRRNSDGKQYTCEIPKGGVGCYTKQVNDAGVTSFAQGSADDGAYSATAKTNSY